MKRTAQAHEVRRPSECFNAKQRSLLEEEIEADLAAVAIEYLQPP